MKPAASSAPTVSSSSVTTSDSGTAASAAAAAAAGDATGSPAKLTAGGTVSFSLTAKKQKSSSSLPKTSVFEEGDKQNAGKSKVRRG